MNQIRTWTEEAVRVDSIKERMEELIGFIKESALNWKDPKIQSEIRSAVTLGIDRKKLLEATASEKGKRHKTAAEKKVAQVRRMLNQKIIRYFEKIMVKLDDSVQLPEALQLEEETDSSEDEDDTVNQIIAKDKDAEKAIAKLRGHKLLESEDEESEEESEEEGESKEQEVPAPLKKKSRKSKLLFPRFIQGDHFLSIYDDERFNDADRKMLHMIAKQAGKTLYKTKEKEDLDCEWAFEVEDPDFGTLRFLAFRPKLSGCKKMKKCVA